MSTEMIERELTELRERVKLLEQQSQAGNRGSWRELIGWEKDDVLFQEVVRLGAEWRAQANAEGH